MNESRDERPLRLVEGSDSHDDIQQPYREGEANSSPGSATDAALRHIPGKDGPAAHDAGEGAPRPGPAGVEASRPEKLSREKLEELVVDALRSVYDPEIPVNVYDLGLIYDLHVTEEGMVTVKMTLTTPACPVAEAMPGMIEHAVRFVHGVTDCDIELVWDPPWNPDMMTEAARLQLNI